MTQSSEVPPDPRQGAEQPAQQPPLGQPTQQFAPPFSAQPYPPFGVSAGPGYTYGQQPGWAPPPQSAAPVAQHQSRSRRKVALSVAALLTAAGIGYAAGAAGNPPSGTTTVAATGTTVARSSSTVQSSAAPSSTWTPAPSSTWTPAPKTTSAAAATTTNAPAPTTSRAPAPTTTRAPAPTPAPGGSISQRNALGSAQDYLDYTAFSRSGLIDQLEYEGYSNADATWAVDHVTVDWNQQAAKKAQEYLDYTSFSRSGLIDQLEYEGFTAAQAEYGVSQAGF